jgi:hypothetical protein
MSTDTMPSQSIPSDLLADGEAVVAAILAGKKPSADLAQRVRTRAAKITADTKAKHGVLQIGTAAIRELRDA